MIRLSAKEARGFKASQGTGERRVRMPQKPRSTTDWADVLLFQIRALKLTPEPERDYPFDAARKWKMDLAWPDWKFFAECDGGEWSAGRHARGAGMIADCEKWNAATLQDWAGFRFTGSQVKSGYAVEILGQWLKKPSAAGVETSHA